MHNRRDYFINYKQNKKFVNIKLYCTYFKQTSAPHYIKYQMGAKGMRVLRYSKITLISPRGQNKKATLTAFLINVLSL